MSKTTETTKTTETIAIHNNQRATVYANNHTTTNLTLFYSPTVHFSVTPGQQYHRVQVKLLSKGSVHF